MTRWGFSPRHTFDVKSETGCTLYLLPAYPNHTSHIQFVPCVCLPTLVAVVTLADDRLDIDMDSCPSTAEAPKYVHGTLTTYQSQVVRSQNGVCLSPFVPFNEMKKPETLLISSSSLLFLL